MNTPTEGAQGERGPQCRDCADNDGTCPYSGKLCDQSAESAQGTPAAMAELQHAEQALAHISNALDDLESSPDQRPVPLLREAMWHIQQLAVQPPAAPNGLRGLNGGMPMVEEMQMILDSEGPIARGYIQAALASWIKTLSTTPAIASAAAKGEGESMVSSLVRWQPGNTAPEVPMNDEQYFLVAVRRKHELGKVWSFPAQFLNNKLLLCAHDDPQSRKGNGWIQVPCDEGEDADIRVTGWHFENSTPNGEYDNEYRPMLDDGDELLAWGEIPQYYDATGASEPAPEAVTVKDVCDALDRIPLSERTPPAPDAAQVPGDEQRAREFLAWQYELVERSAAAEDIRAGRKVGGDSDIALRAITATLSAQPTADADQPALGVDDAMVERAAKEWCAGTDTPFDLLGPKGRARLREDMYTVLNAALNPKGAGPKGECPDGDGLVINAYQQGVIDQRGTLLDEGSTRTVRLDLSVFDVPGDPRRNLIARGWTPPNEVERCEGAQPECGPVEFHDSEGIPLCKTCWDSLAEDPTPPEANS